MTNRCELSKAERIAWMERIIEVPDYATDYSTVLNDHLNDPEPEVRVLAIRGLWFYAQPEFIPPLFAAAGHDPDERVRCQAIRTLGCYIYEGEIADYDFDFGPLEEVSRADELSEEDFEQVRDFLFAIYRDETRSLDERRFAVEALSFLSDDAVLAIIEEAYAHPDHNMKLSAIFSMGRSGGVRWSSILRTELFNLDPELQREAIRSVGELQLTEAGKDLWRLTYSDDREIQLTAIWALGQSGWESAFDRLEELTLEGVDLEVQEAAEAAMEEWFIYSKVVAGEFPDDDGLYLENE